MCATNPLCDLGPPVVGAGVGARPSAFLVNDDEAVLISLQFLFQSAGFLARSFASGRALLASKAARAADCFVLDHRPRGVDGLPLARRLRGLGLAAPIVLTTGFRCGALETLAGAADRIIAAPRVDEALIARLVAEIAAARAALRN